MIALECDKESGRMLNYQQEGKKKQEILLVMCNVAITELLITYFRNV